MFNFFFINFNYLKFKLEKKSFSPSWIQKPPDGNSKQAFFKDGHWPIHTFPRHEVVHVHVKLKYTYAMSLVLTRT